MMAWCIFNTLLRMASRNDMAGQKLITKTMYNKLSDEDKKNTNYLQRKSERKEDCAPQNMSTFLMFNVKQQQ